jgi:hypothetical protein
VDFIPTKNVIDGLENPPITVISVLSSKPRASAAMNNTKIAF